MKASKAKTLDVYILDNGKVRRVSLPDPRVAFCAEFNREAKGSGMRAVTRIPKRSA